MYHKFEDANKELKPGDVAECGWAVTQEWLDAESLPPTMENTCQFCYHGQKDPLYQGPQLHDVEITHACPVIDCSWTNVGSFPFNAKVEEEIREHLESHDVVDWAMTVNELRAEIRDLEDHIDKLHRLSVGGDWGS